MKNLVHIILALFSLSSLNSLHAQVAPAIQWQKCLGGSSAEQANCIQQTTDGGFIVAGYSFSNDGDISAHYGSTMYTDYWIVKMDGAGNLEWQKSLGGFDYDRANFIHQTTDGGYIVAGDTHSNNDGDVSNNHGGYDFWIVKLDTVGNIVWEKSFGGSADDEARCVQQTIDGGYIVAGWVASNNGNVAGNHGNRDCWIIKLDTDGNLVWQKCLGGTSWDEANSIEQIAGGGYIITGYSDSNDGDVSGHHGNSTTADFWVAKLDTGGTVIWQKSLGGTDNEMAYSVEQTTDGGFIAAGYTNSDDGDVTEFHGDRDYWVVRLDSAGNLTWEKTLGGWVPDYAYSIKQTSDNDFVVAGYSSILNIDIDYWIVKLDSVGNIVWQNNFGGQNGDLAYAMSLTDDGGYILAGTSASNNGDVSGNHGGVDYWVVKLCSQPELFYLDADSDGYGNANDTLHGCTIPANYVTDNSDCDDNNPNVHPGAVEISGNCLDDNCDGLTDDFEWTQIFGGSGYDEPFFMSEITDEAICVVGYTASSDGDVSGTYGDIDGWIVKLNSLGGLIWKEPLGGSMQDYTSSVQPTNDGQIIVAGYSESNDGQVSGNHGYFDFWVVKLDSAGNLIWQKCLGGSAGDIAKSIKQTSDGGYIAAGFTGSNDGDVSGNHGVEDYWVVKLDGDGNLIWQKSLGGGWYDEGYSIEQTVDNGFIVAGKTGSNNSGDVSGYHGDYDSWVVKLDIDGNILWQKCLGGSYSEAAYSVQQTTDGNYIVAGYSHSNDGDVSGNHGGSDYWVVKLDTLGNIIWQKTLGGSGDDEAHSIEQTSDGGYIVAGKSNSNDGDVLCLHGYNDVWVVKLDFNGNIEWQKSFGGSLNEDVCSINQTTDGNFAFAGFTWSNDGDISGNHGTDDYWITKFSCPQEVFYADVDNDAYGNPNDSILACTLIPGYVSNHSDCDDANPNIHPGAFEIPNNGFDDDCDGLIDECSVSFTLIPDSLIPHHYWLISDVNGVSPINYLWNWGDGTIDSSAYPSHTYSTAGFYTICLIIVDSTGCSDSTCVGYELLKSEQMNTIITVDVVDSIPGIATAIQNTILLQSWSVFPNPASGNVFVNYSLSTPATVSIEMYDVLGNKLQQEITDQEAGTYHSTISVQMLPDGIYFLQIRAGDQIASKKMVVMN